LNPFGAVAICGLSGMFSKQATEKLREVFEDFFKTTSPLHASPLTHAAVSKDEGRQGEGATAGKA